MGRIIDLCGEIAAVAEEGPDGLLLPPEELARLSEDWTKDDIEDAIGLVYESLFQGELVDAADSLSARLLDVLGAFGPARAFASAEAEGARLSIDNLAQISRRVERLEEILAAVREGALPDRKGFDELQMRLANLGLEPEMDAPDEPDLEE